MSAPEPDRPADLSGVRRALTALPGWSARRERAFHARVLARTTRQDPSWRGDVRLMLDFLARRLESSPALRLVAAALVLHLAAFPVVALMAWQARPPAPQPRITFDLPSGAPFAEPEEIPDAPWSPAVAAARRAEASENAIARARFTLARLEAPVLAPAAAPPAPVRWLERRASGLRTHEWDIPRLAVGATLLERALAVEVALDEWIWTGGPAPREALEHLEAARAAVGATPGAELARLALERGRAYGLLDCEAPPAAGEPCSAAWRAALARAGEATGLASEPAWQAWCR